ncbi:MAG: hypothetical protein IKT13_05650 [Paludibacteraceae bacterium]|nr:hypothetical protein [Paludibacteraceae bacterium]
MTIIWQDDKRKLYVADNEPVLEYHGDTYTFGCQPYEPMALIYRDGKVVANIHNSFRVEDECEVLLSGQLVHTITGKYHNAERFTRLLTTALDTGCNDIDDVEKRMIEGLVQDKGAENIEYASYDFHETKVLYEGVALLLGYFEITNNLTVSPSNGETLDGRGTNDQYIYALAFGYPHNGRDMYEYYLISREEYLDFMHWPERRDWQSHEAAYAWHEAHLAHRQVLCNEFSHMTKSYKPFFTLAEIK